MKERNSGLWLVKVLVMMFVVTGFILVLLAAIILKTSPGTGFISGGLIAAYIIPCFVGGLIAGKRMKKQKYLWGILMGILYFLLLLGVSFILKRGVNIQGARVVSTLLFCSISGMLGGMVS